MCINNNILTFLIPTCNRYIKLNRCIQSIRNIYANAQIIICDNSENTTENKLYSQNILNNYLNIKYIDLKQQPYDLLNAYFYGINNVITKYTFVIDDDDQLCNKKLHKKCFDILKNEKNNLCISFSAIKIEKNKIQYLLNNFPKKIDIKLIPEYWKGDYQTGTCYFPTNLLKEIIYQWNIQHIQHAFDLSHDEVFALYCIYNSNKYVHFNEYGLRINHDFTNSSLNSMLAIYSSRSYIDFLKTILNETNEWAEKYKDIQLKDLQELSNIKLLKTDVFNNKKIFEIEQFITNYINKTNSYKNCRNIITKKVKQIYG